MVVKVKKKKTLAQKIAEKEEAAAKALEERMAREAEMEGSVIRPRARGRGRPWLDESPERYVYSKGEKWISV